MTDLNNERKLDELLDQALRDYSNVEPRVGLEQRILANLATADTAPRRTWLRWWPAFGLAAAAAIALAVFLVMPRIKQPDQNVMTKATSVKEMSPKSSTPAQVARVLPSPRVLRPRVHAARRVEIARQSPMQAASLKQAVFPAPSPLTDQEKLLFAYLRRTDPQEIAANAKPDDEPVLENQLNQVRPLKLDSNSNANMR